MRNRYFLVFVGIVIFGLCGFVFFWVSHPQNQDSIKIYKTTPFAKKRPVKSNASDIKANGIRQMVEERLKAEQGVDTLPPPSVVEAKLIAQYRQIKASPEYEKFMKAYEEKLKATYKQTGLFDWRAQDMYDFYESQGMPPRDAAQEYLELFRDYFPTGEPEDYEMEMAARFHEAFSASSGTPIEARYKASGMLLEEPDYRAWKYGQFKGEIGPHMQWLDEQAVVALALEDASVRPRDGQFTAPGVTNIEMPSPSENDEIREFDPTTFPSGNSENPQSNTTVPPVVNADTAPVPLPAEKITSIRETLHHYGTDEGLLRLLETDAESATWLLKNFNSSDEINTWINENTAQRLPRNQQSPSKRQSFPPEAPLWTEPPE